MEKIIKKIPLFIIITLMCIINTTNYTLADEVPGKAQEGVSRQSQTSSQTQENFTMDSFIGDAQKFINEGAKTGETVLRKEKIKSISDVIYNTLFAFGMIIAVIIGIFIGIRMMLGSIEEKAQYKEYLIPYVVGCVIIFGAFGIWKLVVTIMQSTV